MEENPDVCTVAGARTFQCGGHVQATACFAKSFRIVAPAFLVEIHCEHEAGFVLQHRIDAHDEIFAGVILAREVPSDRLLRHGKKSLMPTFAAFDSGLFADAPDPLIAASGLIA
jgi:hypothetical protein